MLTLAPDRSSFRAFLAAIAVAGAQAWGAPARAAESGLDDVPRLAELVRDTSPWDVDALLGAEPRFAALGADGRRRLLASLEEPVRLWAPLLNFYPGYGVGSLAEGDRRGAWVAGIEVTATVGFMVGVLESWGDSVTETPEHRRRRVRSGRAIAIGSLGVLAVTRVVSITLPFSFHGARHASLDRALSRHGTAPRIAAWIAPIPTGSERGLQAGAALAF
jgi:hypothetical protein